MKNYFFIAVFSLAPFLTFSQMKEDSEHYENLISKTPGSGSLGSYGNVPIDYYRGVPQVNLDLMMLESRNLKLPVSIQYDATGIRQEEIAGPTGMKWNLNAGGSIVRNVNGVVDEEPNLGYLKFASETNYYQNLSNPESWIDWIQKNERDYGPDEFYVTLPNLSFKFVLDKDGNPVAIPADNIKITTTLTNHQLTKFVVTTTDGLKYEFGGIDAAIEKKQMSYMSLKPYFAYLEYFTTVDEHVWFWNTKNGDSDPTLDQPFIDYTRNTEQPFVTSDKSLPAYNSKWHLVSIESPDGDRIDFSYVKKDTDVSYVSPPGVRRIRPIIGQITDYALDYYECDPCSAPLGECDCGTTYRDYVWPDDFYGAPYNIYIPVPKNLYVVKKYPVTLPGSWPGNPDATEVLDHTDASEFFRLEWRRPTPGGVIITQTSTSESVVVLSEIIAATGNKVKFGSSFDTNTSRQDLPNGFYYTSIELQDYNGESIKKIGLNYTFVDSKTSGDFFWVSEAAMLKKYKPDISTASEIRPVAVRNLTAAELGNAFFNKFVLPGLQDHSYYRLFLQSVDDITVSTEPVQLYSFGYRDLDKLRRRTSPLTDYAGFPSEGAVAEPDYKISATTKAKITGSYWPATDKESSPGRAPARGLLTTIYYPTGGKTVFKYSEEFYGNARVTAVEDHDGSGAVRTVRSIEYQDIQKVSKPEFTAYQEYMQDPGQWLKYEVTSSSPLNELYNTKGVLAGSGTVIVNHGYGINRRGWEVYKYIVPRLYPATEDDPDAIDDVPEVSLGSGIWERDFTNSLPALSSSPAESLPAGKTIADAGYIFPFIKYNERDHLRGLLFYHAVYGELSQTTPISETQNFYVVNPTGFNQKTVSGFYGGSYIFKSDDTRYRFANYSITSDKVFLSKIKEVTNDVNNPAKQIIKLQEFEYNPQTFLVNKSTVYNSVNSDKIITTSKYVSDFVINKVVANQTMLAQCEINKQNCLSGCNGNSACISGCNSSYTICSNDPSTQSEFSDVSAMIVLKDNNQIGTPIESKTISIENGVEKIIAASIRKYDVMTNATLTPSRRYAVPVSVWGTSQLLNPCLASPCQTTEYEDAYIDNSYHFDIDSKMRLLHQYQYEGSSSKILSQTGLDGITAQYGWDTKKTVVTSETINGHVTSYSHKPLVGVTQITDPNGIVTKYEYDSKSRLARIRDYEDNILSRYRYHTIADGTDKAMTLRIVTVFPTGFSLVGNFALIASTEDVGGTRYEWNFGDGSTLTTTEKTASHLYASAGAYTVTVNAINSEFGSASASISITATSN